MITNDQELAATRQRIAKFQGWLVQLRQTARPNEFTPPSPIGWERGWG